MAEPNTNSLRKQDEIIPSALRAGLEKVFCELTQNEVICLHLFAIGLTRKDVSRQMDTSERSVRAYLERIADKFEVPARDISLIYHNRVLSLLYLSGRCSQL